MKSGILFVISTKVNTTKNTLFSVILNLLPKLSDSIYLNDLSRFFIHALWLSTKRWENISMGYFLWTLFCTYHFLNKKMFHTFRLESFQEKSNIKFFVNYDAIEYKNIRHFFNRRPNPRSYCMQLHVFYEERFGTTACS